MSDRLLRKHADARVPTGPPNASGTIPTKLIKVPLVGDEIDWTKDIDTDDDAVRRAHDPRRVAGLIENL